jgi:hypothetical protein
VKYKPFKHKITDNEVTWLSNDWYPLSEFDQFLPNVTEDEYLCGLPHLFDNESNPLARIEIVKAGKMDEEILLRVYKSLEK